jgi:hypothetical protein
MQFELGDRLRLRKIHPCGSYEWLVIRLGADIGLRCLGCGRRILIQRSELELRTKEIISHSYDSNDANEDLDNTLGNGPKKK